MEKKKYNELSSAARDAFNRALKIRGSIQMSIDILKELVIKEPAFDQAREKLRAFEKQKHAAAGSFAAIMTQITTLPAQLSAAGLIEKDPLKAMAKCEEILSKNLYVPGALKTLADAALNAGAPFIAIEARMILREYQPGNEKNLRGLAEALQKNHQAMEAVQVFREIAAAHPGDLGIQSELRAALALASMEKSHLANIGAEEDTPAASAVTTENIVTQILEGSIHDATQAKLVIERLTKDLEKNDSTELRRKLSEAYIILEDYDNAIDQLEKIAATLASIDPLIDRKIEEAVVARYNQYIATLQADPAAYENTEQQIAEYARQRDEYALSRAAERARLFPNDGGLNFEYGVKLFESGRQHDAIPYFQQSSKSPNKKVDSCLMLGQCFAANGQHDMAKEQYQIALDTLESPMDRRNLEGQYLMAVSQEARGEQDAAFAAYKEIYQKQANFRDVASKVQQYYAAQKQQ